MSNEIVRQKIVEAFDQDRPGFEAIIDQSICLIRGNIDPRDKSMAIAQCAVTFSDSEDWDSTSVLAEYADIVTEEEMHRIFLAYLVSLTLHRLVWP